MESIVPQQQGGALSAEHYQTFEMAKEHDGILGGTDIAQIRTYAAFARARAQAVHKSIAAMNRLDDVAATKAEMTETAQTFAKVSIYADQRIGEILRELPKAKNQHDVSDLPTGKTQAIKDAGFTPKTAAQLEQLAANPDVVQAVLDKAEAEGRIPSRKQVLDAISERDTARDDAATARKVGETLKRQRDEAREDIEQYQHDVQDLQEEIAALEKQADKAYEDGYKAASRNAQPQVVTREVVPKETQERIKWLEHLEKLHTDDMQKLRKRNEEMRKELDKARDILGMDKTMHDVRRDVQYLINATNSYVRQYGGLTWTAESFAQVDEPTLEDLRKAVRNLATFSNALMTSLEEFNG